MHPWAYVNDARFDAYMVSLVSSDGWEYVGPVEKAPWDRVAGTSVLGAHNVTFDQRVLERLQQDRTVPAFRPEEWVDTADLAVFLRYPRYLEGVCKLAYGASPDKTIRSKMDGLRLVDARAQGFEDKLLQYCLEDSRYAFRFWMENHQKWPGSERKISRLNRESAMHGVRIDWEAVEAAEKSLKLQLFQCEEAIPWNGDDKLLSPKALRKEAAKHKLEVPASLDQRDPVAKAWMEANAPQYPWLMAVRNWRRINTLLSKVQNLAAGRRPDGRFSFESRYMGAVNTGRFAGGPEKDSSDNRFNMYNLPKKPMFDVDLRGFIVPDPGHLLWVYDFAQIEARLLLWRAGDKEMLENCKRYDLYEAYARARLGYSDPRPLREVDKDLRQQSKAIVLGCGYSCGPSKHKDTCEAVHGRVITEDKAKEEVFGYREANPKVVALWQEHQLWLGVAAEKGAKAYEIPLPSGRSLSYFDLEVTGEFDYKGKPRRGYRASTTRGGDKDKLYGGKMTENEIQAIARDVLCDAWLRSHDAGYPVIWSVYDELIGQVPVEGAKEATEKLPTLLAQTPEWLGDCPMAVEGELLERYRKV